MRIGGCKVALVGGECSRGSEGILPQKMLKSRSLEKQFPAFCVSKLAKVMTKIIFMK